MRTVQTLMTCGALLLGSLAHGELSESDIRLAERGQTAVGNPDHLEPVEAYEATGYHESVCRALIGNRRADLWMLVRPSFEPEYAVVLIRHLRPDADRPDADPFAPEPEDWQCAVESVVCKQQIWKKMYPAIRNGEDGRVVAESVPTTKIACPIPLRLAETVADAWESVLRTTHYGPAYGGFDGVIYEFYREPHMFGQTWSPTRGLPRMLTDLGLHLISITKAAEGERAEIIQECIDLAVEITVAAKRKP